MAHYVHTEDILHASALPFSLALIGMQGALHFLSFFVPTLISEPSSSACLVLSFVFLQHAARVSDVLVSMYCRWATSATSEHRGMSHRSCE